MKKILNRSCLATKKLIENKTGIPIKFVMGTPFIWNFQQSFAVFLVFTWVAGVIETCYVGYYMTKVGIKKEPTAMFQKILSIFMWATILTAGLYMELFMHCEFLW